MRSIKKLLLLPAIAFTLFACESTTPEATVKATQSPAPTDTPTLKDTTTVTPVLVVEMPATDEVAVPAAGELPVDPRPEQYDNFFRRTVIVDHTGVLCGYCPAMHYGLVGVAEGVKGERAIIVNSHSYRSSDPMYTVTARKFTDYFNITGFPTANADLRQAKINNNSNTKQLIKTFETKIEELVTKYPAEVNISAVSVLEADKEVKITVAIKVGVEGTYKINALLLEDGIVAKQSSFFPPDEMPAYDTHHHALMGASLDTPDGIELKVLEANKVHKQELTIKIDSKVQDIKNCKLVIYVTSPDTEGPGSFHVSNAVRCKIGGYVPFTYSK